MKTQEKIRKDQFWDMIDNRMNEFINAVGEEPSKEEKMNLRLGIIESLLNKASDETLTSLAVESRMINRIFMVMEKDESGWIMKHKAVNLESAQLLLDICHQKEEYNAMTNPEYISKEYDITSKLVFL